MEFSEWLKRQSKREDLVGKFARAVVGEEDFPLIPVASDLTIALSERGKSDAGEGVGPAVEEFRQALSDARTEEQAKAVAEEIGSVKTQEDKAQKAKDKAEAEDAARAVPDAKVEKLKAQEAADARRAQRLEAERVNGNKEPEKRAPKKRAPKRAPKKGA